MSEEMLIRHCSPTLAGLKTGNIFTCAVSDAEEMRNTVRKWNRRLAKKGLRVMPLRYKDGKAMIYVFRPSRLSRDLAHGTADRILRERGYSPDCPAKCIPHLIRRLSENDQIEDFPHEIGLFLGYPPEDVCGFIENRDDCKCVGCWKVYGDTASAEKLFARYKKCTAVYCRHHADGKPVERLAVCG